VDLNEFTTSWLQYLLSKEMKFENLIRLWGNVVLNTFITNDINIGYICIDSYFSMPDPLEFHPFVCLGK
jgi:hypothetical protein